MIQLKQACQICDKPCFLPITSESPKLGALECGCILHHDCFEKLPDAENSMINKVVCVKCKVECNKISCPLTIDILSNQSKPNDTILKHDCPPEYSTEQNNSIDESNYERQLNLTVKMVREFVNSAASIEQIKSKDDEINRLKNSLVSVHSELKATKTKLSDAVSSKVDMEKKLLGCEKKMRNAQNSQRGMSRTIQGYQQKIKDLKKQAKVEDKPICKVLTLDQCLEICNYNRESRNKLPRKYSDWKKAPDFNELLKLSEIKKLHDHIISDKVVVNGSMNGPKAYILEAIFRDKRLGQIMRSDLYKKLIPDRQSLNRLILSKFGCYLVQYLLDKKQNVDDELYERYFKRIFKCVIDNLPKYVYDQNAAYVLEKLVLFSSDEDKDKFIGALLKEDLKRICTDKYGTHVLQVLVRNVKDPTKFWIAIKLRDFVEKVAIDKYGMYVIEELVTLKTEELKEAFKGYERWINNKKITDKIKKMMGGKRLISKLSE